MLSRESAGIFLYVVEVMKSWKMEGNIAEKIMEGNIKVPNGLYGLYDEYFRRKFENNKTDRYQKAKKILSILISVKESISKNFLQNQSGNKAIFPIPIC